MGRDLAKSATIWENPDLRLTFDVSHLRLQGPGIVVLMEHQNTVNTG